MRATKAPLALTILLLLATCGESGTVRISTTPPSGGGAEITAPPATPPTTEIELVECTGAPPRTWSVLCQATGLIDEVYLESIDPAELAAAAVLGVRGAEAVGTVEPLDETFRCTVPGEAFETLCEEIVDRLSSDHGDLGLLVEAALTGMFQFALDPFSSYVPPDYADRLDDLGSGVVYDLGMSVSARTPGGEACGVISERCRLLVVGVFAQTPAAAEGLVVGDAIVAVDGEELDGLSADAATAALFGPAGLAVEVTVQRDSGRLTKTLVREDLRLAPVEFEMITPTVAYVRLNEFSQPSAQLIGDVLQTDEVQSASGMVLDLRDNPGGLVLAVQAIASQFLDGGDVLVERGRDFEFAWPVIGGGLAPPGLRLVVLVNRGSASASEVLAAVLQERGRATVVGEPTFGKNLVQTVYTARDGGQLRVTIAKWETPGGRDIGITGLEPDVLVEPDVVSGSDPIFDEALRQLGL